MNVLIVGVGLIGGSFALALREHGLAARIDGVESSEEHAVGRSNGAWSTAS